MAATRRALTTRERELAAVEAAFSEAAARSQELVDGYVRRMLVELESGGNVRLEDGRPSDVWYSSCQDLLASRFLAPDFAGTAARPHHRATCGALDACAVERAVHILCNIRCIILRFMLCIIL